MWKSWLGISVYSWLHIAALIGIAAWGEFWLKFHFMAAVLVFFAALIAFFTWEPSDKSS
jgi:hypothetical protein